MKNVQDRKSALKKIKSLVLYPKAEVEQFRQKLDAEFSNVFLPNGVEKQEKVYGGVKCDLLIPEMHSSHRVILYIHGGSFAGGSRDSWRGFCSSLANSSSSRVLVPEFRLPPTHPYPASLEDIQAVFRMLYAEEIVALKKERGEFYNEERDIPEIIIASDGSGASIACALIFKLGERYKKCLGRLLLFSPWLDMSEDAPFPLKHHGADEVLSPEAIRRAVDLYTYSSNVSNPLVSPLKASPSEFEGFPPVYIQCGEKEMLLEQIKAFSEKLNEEKIFNVLDIWPDMMFMFQFADEYLQESYLAVDKAGQWIKEKIEEE